ncbi:MULTISPECIES: NAD(P)-binding domain-containing protein [Streptomyces]|uniref:NAD(P)-binding domain-containing protein n=2 Tax=Streptomyces TaxID=1883 RepID=A0ABU4K2D9_9ACTN|nr:NAD(P)-binding domain-containing protein [Streptomyces roseolus]MDX2291898.1 NAD(P)-binding domain-containing protein [Streptomyces roseolus]
MEHVDVAVIGAGRSHPVLARPVQLASGVALRRRRGDPDRYPPRDEGVAYLTRYAERPGADLRTGHRVTAVRPAGEGSALDLDSGRTPGAGAVVAATGGFGRPKRPAPPGLDTFTGAALHVSEHRAPAPFAGQRVVVVGAEKSAVRVAVELAEVARVGQASRAPVRWFPQRPLGGDLPFRLAATGLDTAPLGAPHGIRRRWRSSTAAATAQPPPPAGRTGAPCSPASTDPSSRRRVAARPVVRVSPWSRPRRPACRRPSGARAAPFPTPRPLLRRMST